MKFMRKVGNGEITIEDGQVKGAEAHEEAEARSWVREFSEDQDQASASKWAAEFTPGKGETFR